MTLLFLSLVLFSEGGGNEVGNEGGNEGGSEGGNEGGNEGGSEGGSEGGNEGGSEGGGTGANGRGNGLLLPLYPTMTKMKTNAHTTTAVNTTFRWRFITPRLSLTFSLPGNLAFT